MTGRRLTMTILVIALMTSGFTAEVAVSDADVRLRPDEGTPGESITVRGRDFPAETNGAIDWDGVGSPVGTFTTDDSGDFEVTVTVPDLPAGDYRVSATAGDTSTDDGFEIEANRETPVSSAPVATPPAIDPAEITSGCADQGKRDVDVTNAAELTAALADAQPGDRIRLGEGTYPGNFVAGADASVDRRIALCGTRSAVIDGGGWQESGYALHLTGNAWSVEGIAITNAQKGVMIDGANFVILNGIEVHTTGHEAVHFRTHSSDNVIANSDIHDTGLDNEKFGEGVYLGSAVSNWEKYTNGDPDESNRNQVLANRIWNTSSESIDVKEGTEGGVIEGNSFDGAGMSGADSWVDMKGNGYVIRGNTGVNSPRDGFQTHVIDNLEWGRDNVFETNVATVNADGVGFYIHQPDDTGNTVRCDNIVEAASAFSNLEPECVE